MFRSGTIDIISTDAMVETCHLTPGGTGVLCNMKLETDLVALGLSENRELPDLHRIIESFNIQRLHRHS